MKMTMSSATLVGLMGVAVFGLAMEGAKSLITKYQLEDRVTYLERLVDNLTEKQNYLFELLANQPAMPAAPSVGVSAIQVEKTGRTVAHEDLDEFCLSKNIFHEASIEDDLGMFAVAQVTLNRVRNANYPNTICDVVMQPAQFSWTNDKNRRWSHPSGPQWDKAKTIAKQVIKEGYRVPALQSAMFYHADYTKPNWRKPEAVIAQVGTHVFYASAR